MTSAKQTMKATAQDIRQSFLDYFARRGHKVVESQSLIPQADPSLLFVNAGMVQFKDYFTGERSAPYPTACSVQKCLRVSGKHNDLEQVGLTPRHHTFFEMLGNFSFGDYFKREAIRYAWEYLTEVLRLPVERLWVTVHPDDGQADGIWRRDIGVPQGRMAKDPENFWTMADIGPCGPCSEIHYDLGEHLKGTHPVLDPGDRFMEVWNLVFMQFERKPDGTMAPLPSPSIDTGMGLERIASVAQGVHSNYETHLFAPLIQCAARLLGVDADTKGENLVALRVIADHARAAAFLVADGIIPENEGRGYVLRRIVRRALRYGHRLGATRPFLSKVCDAVVENMGDAWPELVQWRSQILETVGQEEERFLQTLAGGLAILQQAIDRTKGANRRLIDGETVFTLYDTHGFPVDLTALVAREAGLGVDEEGFQRLMEEQRRRGRASWKAASEQLAPVGEWARRNGISTAFVGYQVEQSRGKVLALFKGDEQVDMARTGNVVLLVTDQTPFYGEAGGQVGDSGWIRTPDSTVLVNVVDTQRARPDVVVHVCKLQRGSVSPGLEVELEVDGERRAAIRRHHSATHLLHHALRSVLGPHVRQRGSLVAPDRLRFDFSHGKAVGAHDLRRIEDMVNTIVMQDLEVKTTEMPLEEARASGALHFFDEKYGDVVRLVEMGESRELCGGTHVSRTGQIGPFLVLSESSVSAGVRRIEALAGAAALRFVRVLEQTVDQLRELLKVEPKDLPARVKALQEQLKAAKRKEEEMALTLASGTQAWEDMPERQAGEFKIRHAVAPQMDARALRGLADRLRDRVGNGTYVLITMGQGPKQVVLLAATRDVARERPAGQVLKEALLRLGGRGGGNPQLAQGQAPVQDPGRILDAVTEVLAK